MVLQRRDTLRGVKVTDINGGHPVLTTSRVADLAGCTTSNIRRLTLSGVLRVVGRSGQTLLFDEAEIMAWLPLRRRRGERPGAGRFRV